MKNKFLAIPLFIGIASTNVSADIHVKGLLEVLERNNISQEMVIDRCEEKKDSDRQTWFFVSYIDGNNVSKRVRISCNGGDAVDYEIHRITDKEFDNDQDHRYRTSGSSGSNYYSHSRSYYHTSGS